MAQKKRLDALKSMQETSALYKVGKQNVEENDKMLIKLIKLWFSLLKKNLNQYDKPFVCSFIKHKTKYEIVLIQNLYHKKLFHSNFSL